MSEKFKTGISQHVNERIRAIHVNSSGGLYVFVVGGEPGCSGQDPLDDPIAVMRITSIDKVMVIGPHGASYVYRVYCKGADVKERIEIPAEAVALTILEEVK